MKAFFSALALCASFIGTSATAHEPQAVINDSFVRGQFNWTRGTTNYFVYRYIPIILEGELHVCGAFAVAGSNRINNKFHKQAMQEAWITVNGETALRRLSYFNWLGPSALQADLIGSNANCRGTGLMAESTNGMSVAVNFRQGSYRVRR